MGVDGADDWVAEGWSADAFYVPFHTAVLHGLGVEGIETAAGTVAVDARFLAFLIDDLYRRLPFDAGYYRWRYPDIEAAVQAGQMGDPRQHFLTAGRTEGRMPFAAPFDAAFYAGDDPALLDLLAREGEEMLRRHWEVHGRHFDRPPHPAFADSMSLWRDVLGRRSSALAFRSIDDALILPFPLAVVAGARDSFRGGLVLGDSAEDLRLRQRRDGWAVDSFPANDEPVHALPGEWVYGGPCFDHFGHVMAEMMHRVLPARARVACRKLIFVAGVAEHAPPGGWDDLSSPMRQGLAFLDVAPADVIVLRDNRRVERLHVAQQGAEMFTPPTSGYLALLNAFTPKRLDALPRGGPVGERLYVSRSRIGEGGLILGEAYVEKQLEAEGWTVFHPQYWPLVDQLQAYRHARTIFFPAGSACHGTELFGARDLGHCVLLPRGHAGNTVFEPILRPRARRFDVLTGATFLGTALALRGTGEPLVHLGIGMLNLPAFLEEMRRLGLAELREFDPAAYRAQARADFMAYLTLHRSRVNDVDRFSQMIAPAELARLEERCLNLLG